MLQDYPSQAHPLFVSEHPTNMHAHLFLLNAKLDYWICNSSANKDKDRAQS